MEQLAQFVTKSFEFNNCFSAKLLETKQKLATGDGFLNFGLNGTSSSASNASSNGCGNSSLMDLRDSGASNEEDEDSQSKDNPEKGANMVENKCLVERAGKCEGEDEDEDEIDIETDSMSDMEDNKKFIHKSSDNRLGQNILDAKSRTIFDAQMDRLRVIKPADLRINKSAMMATNNAAPGLNKDVPSDKVLDSNNNNTVIKPALIATKNWLIPDSPSSSSE